MIIEHSINFALTANIDGPCNYEYPNVELLVSKSISHSYFEISQLKILDIHEYYL